MTRPMPSGGSAERAWTTCFSAFLPSELMKAGNAKGVYVDLINNVLGRSNSAGHASFQHSRGPLLSR